MFDPKADKDDKLRTLRADFESCVDHQNDAQHEAHRAARFYHNTNNEGQWEQGDLDYLRSIGRTAFTFNLIKPTVDKFIGQVRDQQRTPKAEPVGGEDEFAAEVLNNVSERVEDMEDLDALYAQTLKDGVIEREKSLRVHAMADPENPAHVKIEFRPVPCYELHWDPASRRPDRADARYLFWDKWLSKWEFQQVYPGHDWDEIVKQGDREWSDDSLTSDWSEDPNHAATDYKDMYESGRWERYYYNRQRNKVRVIHAEYRIPEKRYFLVDPSSGVSEAVSKDVADNVGKFTDAGMLPPGLEVRSTWKDRIYTVQWVGPEILYDDWMDEPFDGFSICTFSYAVDSETGLSYGMLRNLFDPQMEVNKAHNLMLEQMSGQSKPGLMAEKQAIEGSDLRKIEDQLRTNGGIAVFADDALSQGRIKERSVTQISPAVTERLERGKQGIREIANVMTDDGSPAAQAEAAATVQLRYRASLIAMSDVLDSWECFQRGIKRRVLQAIVRGMPDSQITEYLGNSQKFQVQQTPQGTVVAEINAETGQPEKAAPLQKLRTLRYDVRLEVSSDNTTLRLMEAQGLLQIAQIGMPVAPEVIYSKLVSSRAEREKLTGYAEQMQRQQAQSAQMEQQAAQQQIERTLAVEEFGEQEKARHNRATEMLTAQKQAAEYDVDMGKIMQAMDETETKAFVEVVKAIEKRQTQRTSIPAQSRRV